MARGRVLRAFDWGLGMDIAVKEKDGAPVDAAVVAVSVCSVGRYGDHRTKPLLTFRPRASAESDERGNPFYAGNWSSVNVGIVMSVRSFLANNHGDLLAA